MVLLLYLQRSFKYLRKLSIIQPFVTAALLFVFAFAITPKRYLHNLVANHKDTACSKLTNGKTELTKAGFNCQADNLVATSPFTNADEKPEIKVPVFFVSFYQEAALTNLSSTHISLTLRGPPALCVL